MAQIRVIKKRMKAVKNIRRITKTMQMIATSKFARAQQRAVGTKPYTEGVFELVKELAATAGNVTHPLIDGPVDVSSDAKELTLILTSDRGLCGPYNGSILKRVMNAFKTNNDIREGEIELVGKKGASFLRFNKVEVSKHHEGFGDAPTFEQIETLANEYMERFIAGEITKVNVIYMRYISAGRQTAEQLQLLPLKAPQAEEATTGGPEVDYEFSPKAEELLSSLLPEAVKSTLFQAVNDSIVSEHVARMIAMKAATDNAGKMGTALKRQFNRARQAQITTELTEIISGAAALE